ncbi:hypothetical protein F5B21DRAFT_388067 [Xylaria acuta]|nr:hypothetical protein F5B21DRAFT_388067 [Xylaria acuta]
MASAYSPRHLKEQHLNLGFHSFPSFWKTPSQFLQSMLTRFTPKGKIGKFPTKGNGYNAIQSTHPQTLGYGLTDSPAGLLAWVYEKLHDWEDEYPWTEDEICTILVLKCWAGCEYQVGKGREREFISRSGAI